jgi:K+-transporting ATPase KdpF subunit
MNAIILIATTKLYEMNSPAGYIFGAIIALFILGYLFYSLVKPEKF